MSCPCPRVCACPRCPMREGGSLGSLRNIGKLEKRPTGLKGPKGILADDFADCSDYAFAANSDDSADCSDFAFAAKNM